MVKRKILLLFICFAALCLTAAPARADMVLFDFHYGSLTSTYTSATGAFSASMNPVTTSGSVTRLEAPIGWAQFWPGVPGQPPVESWWNTLGGDFLLEMTIDHINAGTADGSGTFTITDTGGDTITGGLAGDWIDMGPSNVFVGTLSNVLFVVSDDGNFDGHSGSVSMSFTSLPPWYGTLIELSTTSTWFSEGDYTTNSGSVDASVVPVPAAVILGVLGLGVVGWKLRKYA